MKSCLFLFLLLLSSLSFAQTNITGVVSNKKREHVFAANVYLKSTPTKGVTTDFKGKFSLTITKLTDTLVVSFIGYETQETPLLAHDLAKPINVVLKESSKTIEEVIITAQDPISEQFSVVKIEKLDIYFNPVSQGDPLKAITVLPASTTTNETASVSLRGSSPDRSRVTLNGVPVYNPVRASLLNNQGFFSLFNTEIINKQYVYASNPPLTYGNTSAGLVEIQTLKKLEASQLQLSATLASLGLFLSQNIKRDVAFVQLYGNYQFSDAFKGIQEKQMPNIKNFYTSDVGLNFRTKLGKRCEFNSYNYYIDESFNGYSQSYTYSGSVASINKRFFTVNNWVFYSKTGVLSINNGVNRSKSQYSFGNIKSDQEIRQVYTSVDYKWHLFEDANIQFGFSHDYNNNLFNDSIPVYYYALSPGSPNYLSDTSISNHSLEAYLYSNWNLNNKVIFTSGIRSNYPNTDQDHYLSAQLGLKYSSSKKHSFLLSGGKYHNYSTPNYYSKSYNLLTSYQVALDYTFTQKSTLVKAATYYKDEAGEQAVNTFFSSEHLRTFGIELYLEQDFYNYFKLSFSNSFIDQKLTIGNKQYHGFSDFNYLIKTTLQFNNPKLFNLALNYTGRPGTFYNQITGSVFDAETGFYQPIYINELNADQFASYNRFDFSLSKYIKMPKNTVIIFASINNVFDTKNQETPLYNLDYSSKNFKFYQQRMFYFGLVWRFDY